MGSAVQQVAKEKTSWRVTISPAPALSSLSQIIERDRDKRDKMPGFIHRLFGKDDMDVDCLQSGEISRKNIFNFV